MPDAIGGHGPPYLFQQSRRRTMEDFFTQIARAVVSGLMMGMVFGLVALGLTIIFGVMDIVNFAHGEFLMIGMYCGLLTATGLHVDPLFGLPVAAVVGFLLGSSVITGWYAFSCADLWWHNSLAHSG